MKKRTKLCIIVSGLLVVIAGGVLFLRSDYFSDLKYPPEDRACRKFLRKETDDAQSHVPLAEIREVRLSGITFPKEQHDAIQTGKITPNEMRIIDKTLRSGELAVLVSLPNLETLWIDEYKNFDDTHFASLPTLPTLKNLALVRTAVTEKSIPAIAAMKSLEFIRLERAFGFRDVQGKETMYWIPESPWTDKTLEYLSTCTALKTITLRGPSTISDEGLKHLGKMSNLESVMLDAPQITWDGVRYLQTLPNLKSAWLDGVDKNRSFTHHTLENGGQTIYYREQGVTLSE
jgi:hypothetical protein